jgi:aryl-alcohol dehydrogenase-like predicted oxidoreductase
MNRIWPAKPGTCIKEVFPHRYVMESTETSLRNLGRDTIDLQQLHVWNPEWLESDEWRRAFEDLKRSGKVRFVGVSINDHQPDSALGLIETGLIDTVQVIYNIFDQAPGYKLFPACLKHNVGVLARVPLDEGSLTGAISDASEFDPGEFRAMYFRGDRKQAVVARVARLAAELEGQPLPEVALRFSITPEAVSTSIPGMRRVRHVEANVRAADLGALPPELAARLGRHLWVKNFYQ